MWERSASLPARLLVQRSSAFILVATISGLMSCATSTPTSRIVFADEAHELAARGESTLIDVRLPRERTDEGFAMNVTAWISYDRSAHDDFVATVERVVRGDRTHPITLICAIGERSQWALSTLTRAGFSNVTSIDQGYVAWRAENLPMTQSIPSHSDQVPTK
jgi:rhodanese-related sulfurtransferase